jgi:hypothetical protein
VDEDVGLNGLELVLRKYEANPERERCGELRLVLAKALAGERNRSRRARIAAMLERVEDLLIRAGRSGAAAGLTGREP